MKKSETNEPSERTGSQDRLIRRHLWHVVYDTIFESSSGMERYSIRHENLEGHVATQSSSVVDVEREIAATLGNQSRLTCVHKATWLGEMLNAI